MTERDEALAPEREAELAEALGGHWPSGDPRTHEATCGCHWRSGEHFLGDAEGAHEAWVAHVVEAVAPLVAGWLAEAEAAGHDAGVRQAAAWLRADYPAYSGPEWRERGAEWIEDRHADARRAALAEPGDQSGEAK